LAIVGNGTIDTLLVSRRLLSAIRRCPGVVVHGRDVHRERGGLAYRHRDRRYRDRDRRSDPHLGAHKAQYRSAPRIRAAPTVVGERSGEC
jgi:hypothetical protein